MVTNTASPTTSQAQEATSTDRSHFLRRVLQGNAVFSTASGLLFLFGGEAVARFLGLPDAASIMMVMSVGLFLWAGLTLWVATQATPHRLQVFLIIEGDLLWVAASIILLLTGWLPLSTAGMWGVAFVADIVALFAILQYVGWRRMNA